MTVEPIKMPIMIHHTLANSRTFEEDSYKLVHIDEYVCPSTKGIIAMERKKG